MANYNFLDEKDGIATLEGPDGTKIPVATGALSADSPLGLDIAAKRKEYMAKQAALFGSPGDDLTALPPEVRARLESDADRMIGAATADDRRAIELPRAREDLLAKERAAMGAPPQMTMTPPREPATAPGAPAIMPGSQAEALMKVNQRASMSVAQPQQSVASAPNPFGGIERDISNYVKSQEQEGKEKAEILASKAASMESLMQAQKEVDQRLEQENEDIIQAIKTNKIDPNKFWSDQTTGQRVGTFITALLSGLGGDPKYIERAIEKDIKAQIDNQNTNLSLYKTNLERFKNKTDALNATRAQMLAAYDAQIEMAGAKAMGPQAALKTAELRKSVADAKMKSAQALRASQVLARASQNGIPVDMEQEFVRTQMTPEQQKDWFEKSFVLNGKAYQARSPKDAEAIKVAATAADDIIRDLNELDKLMSLDAKVPGTAANQKAVSIMAGLPAKIGVAQEQGALGDAERENYQKSFSNPTAILSSPERSKQLKSGIKAKLESTIMNRAMGRPPTQSAAGFVPFGSK